MLRKFKSQVTNRSPYLDDEGMKARAARVCMEKEDGAASPLRSMDMAVKRPLTMPEVGRRRTRMQNLRGRTSPVGSRLSHPIARIPEWGL